MEELKMDFDPRKISNSLFQAPQDPIAYETTLRIDRATKEMLRLKHRLVINADWEATAIAVVMAETLVHILYSHITQNGVQILEDDANYINFYDLIEIGASNKINKRAEKTGNINVIFKVGTAADAIISDDIPDSEKKYEYISPEACYSYPDDTARTSAMLKIDRIARKQLAEKYAIVLAKDYQAIAASTLFYENIYREIIRTMVLENKSTVIFNFYDIIEFSAVKKDDMVTMYLKPGYQSKLIIKSDDNNREDDEDEE